MECDRKETLDLNLENKEENTTHSTQRPCIILSTICTSDSGGYPPSI
jgi:hypothetical protein